MISEEFPRETSSGIREGISWLNFWKNITGRIAGGIPTTIPGGISQKVPQATSRKISLEVLVKKSWRISEEILVVFLEQFLPGGIYEGFPLKHSCSYHWRIGGSLAEILE